MDLKKKILLIGPLPPPYGGARVSFYEFYSYLKNLPNIKIIHFDLPLRKNRGLNPPGSVNHIKTVIGLFSSISNMLAVQSVIIFGSKNFLFTYGVLLAGIAKLLGKTCYVRFFGGHPMHALEDRPTLLKRLLLTLLNLNTGVFVETDIGKREFPIFLQKKISVVFGYRPAFFLKNNESQSTRQTAKFVYVGDVSLIKGIGVLLQAFSLLPSLYANRAELHIYGAIKDNCFENINKISHVIYHGVVDNRILCRELSEYDVFVFPSLHLSEGHPGVIIEAFMAGLPVIATSLSGPSEIVKEGDNGLLVTPNDPDGLAEKMCSLIHNRKLLYKLSKGAILSSSLFDTSNVIPKLIRSMKLDGGGS